MKKTKLIIGKIPYANLFPIYYYLENKCKRKEYEFINGVPSSLNKMLRQGRIDVSPSSSIEYLKHKNKYSLIPWLSLSSSGPVRSIYLFSKYPIEKLNKKTIAVSSQAETSVVLLNIILKDFLSLKCHLKTVDFLTTKKILRDFPACLLIGDDAMKARKTVASYKLQACLSGRQVASKNSELGTRNSELYIYDLGELWFKYTRLPFVFALWIVKKKSLYQKKELIKKLASDLINAKRYALRSPSLIARSAPQRKWLSAKELVNYWKGISYNFTDKHMEGLKLFEKHAFKY